MLSAAEASEQRVVQALEAFADLRIARYPHAILRKRTWELRTNFTAYDGTYVALAEALAEGGAPLLTADARLAKATRRHTGLEVLLAR